MNSTLIGSIDDTNFPLLFKSNYVARNQFLASRPRQLAMGRWGSWYGSELTSCLIQEEEKQFADR